ncbi:helix-turn-helix domain-containing protein [Turicibacter sanguinis]
MSYHHLNGFERTRIEVLSRMGHTTRQIAELLNCHHLMSVFELK